MNKNKHKSKGKKGSTADFEFGEWPFLDGVPSADAADAARYRYLTSPECDILGATKERWDAWIDERRMK